MAKIVSTWDDDTRTLYRLELDTGWTWKEFVNAIDSAYLLIGKLEHDVNFIMWFKSSLPPGDARTHLKHAGGTQPPNLRHTVMVNNSTRFLDILVQVMDRKQGWDGPKILQTLDEARDYLKTLD